MRRHVALFIETSSSYGRDLLKGIARYMRLHDEWSVFLEQHDLHQEPPDWLESWQGDGIISRVTSPRLLNAVQKNGIPLVELTDRYSARGQPHVRSNDAQIAEMALEHLLERGFRNFGFCGFIGEDWSELREAASVAFLSQQQNHSLAIYRSAWHGAGAVPWEREQNNLQAWLRGLPKPVGILACNDIRGQHVLDACRKVPLAVPEEVAVIGVDNDELLCSICVPPLSSVIPHAEAVGFRAAELLDAAMRGQPLSPQAECVSPLAVATRQSTDVVAIDDPELASALHFIRQNACRGISVDDVTRAVGLSRSTLERRLRQHLGRTPQQEIRHVQVRRARELLSSSDLSVSRIAELCGFEHTEYFHVVFKRHTGVTPGEFRLGPRPPKS